MQSIILKVLQRHRVVFKTMPNKRCFYLLLADPKYQRLHKSSDSRSHSSEQNNTISQTEEYFKNAWKSINQDNVEEKHSDGEDFGKLVQQINLIQKDFRNPNERLEENQSQMDTLTEHEKDTRLSLPLTKYGRIGQPAEWYSRRQISAAKSGNIKAVVDIYEYEMMKRDRVKPTKYFFSRYIAILGRAGYHQKAFDLFRQMKRYDFDISDHLYTSLFNACANSPVKSDALKRAHDLYNDLIGEGININIFTVKTAVKAFAFLGDYPQAFVVVEEAASRMGLDIEVFEALLMACASDKHSGFLRALQVWQKISQHGQIPRTFTYNLLIRCVRDCGIGDEDTFQRLFYLDKPADKYIKDIPLFKLDTEISNVDVETVYSRIESKKEYKNTDSDRPYVNNSEFENTQVSYLHENPNFCEVISQLNNKSSVTKENNFDENEYKTISNEETIEETKVSLQKLNFPEGRLVALGGFYRILEHMKRTHNPPDIVTFTQLLACLPNDEESEEQLLDYMEKQRFQLDVDFLNDIMLRRMQRDEISSGKDILKLMSRKGLQANFRTYANLGLSCRTAAHVKQLLKSMENANLEPTAAVFGHIILGTKLNFGVKISVLTTMEQLGVSPSKALVSHIERQIAFAKRRTVEAERNGDVDAFVLSPKFMKTFKNFLNFYNGWLERVQIEKIRHPWAPLYPEEQEKSAEEELPREVREKIEKEIL